MTKKTTIAITIITAGLSSPFEETPVLFMDEMMKKGTMFILFVLQIFTFLLGGGPARN